VSGRTIARIGLSAALLGLLLPVLDEGLHLAERDQLDTLAGWLLRGAGVALLLALSVWVLEKAGVRMASDRCSDCGRRVPYGHRLCADHLQARTFAAREKHHGRRGMGI
jgi:hypothetical protein